MSVYEPVNIYDPDKEYTLELDRVTYLMSRVRNHSVLHFGCADYPVTEERLRNNTLLHSNLVKTASYIFGIDSSSEGIQVLRDHGIDNLEVMDAEHPDLNERFDLVLIGDILEHLSNPGNLLQHTARLLNPSGKIIISVPNSYSYSVFDFIIRGVEPTHKEHTNCFSVKTLCELCARYDLLPVKLVFTAQPRGQNENPWFIAFRNILLRIQKRLSPSFIMEFTEGRYVDTSKYFQWK
jgi:SAM-dependent methyltransferase